MGFSEDLKDKLEFLYDWLGYIVIQAAELSKKMLENPVLERV